AWAEDAPTPAPIPPGLCRTGVTRAAAMTRRFCFHQPSVLQCCLAMRVGGAPSAGATASAWKSGRRYGPISDLQALGATASAQGVFALHPRRVMRGRSPICCASTTVRHLHHAFLPLPPCLAAGAACATAGWGQNSYAGRPRERNVYSRSHAPPIW